jgi:hypothetical protein
MNILCIFVKERDTRKNPIQSHKKNQHNGEEKRKKRTQFQSRGYCLQ